MKRVLTKVAVMSAACSSCLISDCSFQAAVYENKPTVFTYFHWKPGNGILHDIRGTFKESGEILIELYGVILGCSSGSETANVFAFMIS